MPLIVTGRTISPWLLYERYRETCQEQPMTFNCRINTPIETRMASYISDQPSRATWVIATATWNENSWGISSLGHLPCAEVWAVKTAMSVFCTKVALECNTEENSLLCTWGVSLGWKTLVLKIPVLPLLEEGGAGDGWWGLEGETLWMSYLISAWVLERDCPVSPCSPHAHLFLYRFTLNIFSFVLRPSKWSPSPIWTRTCWPWKARNTYLVLCTVPAWDHIVLLHKI